MTPGYLSRAISDLIEGPEGLRQLHRWVDQEAEVAYGRIPEHYDYWVDIHSRLDDALSSLVMAEELADEFEEAYDETG